MAKGDLVSTLDALYAIDSTDDVEWMQSVVRAMPALVPKPLGTNGLMYDLTTRPPRTWALVNESSPLESEILAAAVESSIDDYTTTVAQIPVAAASEGPNFEEQPWLEELFRPRGIEDVLTLNAYNPNGIGCSIVQTVASRLVLRPKQRDRLTRFATHLASAARLRWRLRRAPTETPEAVLSPDGKELHAEGDATLDDARRALKEAAIRIEKVRSTRAAADDALEQWRPLVSAKWTLVDKFESDGKRFIVAQTNEVARSDRADLTAREKQVVALLALGHHGKLIAYELGISASTVRVLLARAARRLGAKTRNELLRKARLQR